jgi:ABC-type lipoprotein release transport system permease subunit
MVHTAWCRHAGLLTTIGIVLGLSVAGYLMRFIERKLYGVDPLDARTFAGAAVLMIVTAGAAANYPARRAAYADPMTTLRCE